MSLRANLKNRIARALAAHAVLVGDPDHAEWTNAMIHEQEYLPPDASALSWALGCVFVAYRARLRSMTRLPDLPPWALFVCLLPPCANFIHVAVSTAQGYPIFPSARLLPYTLTQEGLIFGSATLIGPVGLAAALWTLSSPARRPGTIFMVVLWTLTALGTVYVGVPFLSAEWRALATPLPVAIWDLLLNFVLLPALAVAQLQRLEARRRSPAAAYHGLPLLEATNLTVNPIVSAPKMRALGLGVLSYFGLAAIVRWLLPHVPHLNSADLLENGSVVIHAILLIFLIAPGIVLGMAAKRSPLMHGILLGVLIVGFMALLILVAGMLGVKDTVEALYPFGSLAVATVLALMIGSSLGAVLGDFISARLRGL